MLLAFSRSRFFKNLYLQTSQQLRAKIEAITVRYPAAGMVFSGRLVVDFGPLRAFSFVQNRGASMGTEQILKLQPDRTLYLRGFTGVGSAAALCKTSPTGFTVSGVFRDMADFCVLNIYDADNTFEHYTVRYLPDFNLQGMVLSFDVAYQGLQPLDSAKYSWIDWSTLDVIREDGTTKNIRLWENAQLISSNYSVASGPCHFATPTQGCTIYDRLTLFVNNVNFDFVANGGESAAQIAAFFANAVNTYDWSKFDSHSISVLAAVDGVGGFGLKLPHRARVGLGKPSPASFGNSVPWYCRRIDNLCRRQPLHHLLV